MSLCLFVVLLTGCASKQPVAEKQAVKAEVKAEKEGIGLNPLNWPWNPLAWEFKRAAEGEMELNPYYWSVNPMHWDYKEANYNFREKYNFKLGPMWVIKPPRELNPSQIVVVRHFGMAPAVPQVQESVPNLRNLHSAKRCCRDSSCCGSRRIAGQQASNAAHRFIHRRCLV